MSHISLPWRPGPRGNFARTTSRRQEVESRMYQLIFVNPGERFMRNDIGTPLIDWIGEPVDEVFTGLVEVHAKAMIHSWIEDVQVIDVTVTREEVETPTSIDTHVTIFFYWRDLRSAEVFESNLTRDYRKS